MLLGADALGRLVPGQINTGGATAIVPVISAPFMQQPQLRGKLDQARRVALAASGEVRTIIPVIPSFGWFANLSLPTTRPKLPARHQQVVAFNPQPFVSFGWFGALSSPQKLQKKGINSSLQQFLAYQANPTTVTPFAWFATLSDPVRVKRRLREASQKYETIDTVLPPPPLTLLQGWYNWYSEPVRFKPALKWDLQRAWTGPDRLLPTPDVTVTLQAIEINNDEAIIAIRVFPYNPPASATVSIVEIGDDGSATSVVEV